MHSSSESASTGDVSNPKELLSKSLTEPLEPPDSHYFNAAEGWLGLGDHRSALDELEFISPVTRSHPNVLALQCEIYTSAQNWAAVVAISWMLVELVPDQPIGWVSRSFGLHELKKTKQAFDLLLPAAEKFPGIATIPYNLACYCAQLGKLEEAQRWLNQSYAVGNAADLKLQARRDPDLVPLFGTPFEL